MVDDQKQFTGGCLCGALRYEAWGEPLFAGFCYCTDCRKASGSGAIPFIGMSAAQVRFSGEARQFRSVSIRGTEAVRNFCPVCGGLVFGGEVGKDNSHTLYAGSLDDPSVFQPAMAIFLRDKPEWVIVPEGLAVVRDHAGLRTGDGASSASVEEPLLRDLPVLDGVEGLFVHVHPLAGLPIGYVHREAHDELVTVHVRALDLDTVDLMGLFPPFALRARGGFSTGDGVHSSWTTGLHRNHVFRPILLAAFTEFACLAKCDEIVRDVTGVHGGLSQRRQF